MSGGGRLELLGSRVIDLSALRLAFAAWEEDHLALVRVEALDVQLELLLTRVSSSVINRDSDGACESSGQSGAGEFREGKATSVSDLASVPSRCRRNNWAEFLDWAGEGVRGLCDSTLVSSKLLCRLIEVALGSSVPVLAQMHVLQSVVVLDHC